MLTGSEMKIVVAQYIAFLEKTKWSWLTEWIDPTLMGAQARDFCLPGCCKAGSKDVFVSMEVPGSGPAKEREMMAEWCDGVISYPSRRCLPTWKPQRAPPNPPKLVAVGAENT